MNTHKHTRPSKPARDLLKALKVAMPAVRRVDAAYRALMGRPSRRKKGRAAS